jgi:hypothetical protein
MKEIASSRSKALILCLIPFLMLCYFLAGALSNGIFIPGRDGAFMISGQSAWLACLFPLFWLAGDIVRHYPTLDISNISRKIIATSLTLVGVGVFFYAIIS